MQVNICGKRKGRKETWVEECMAVEQCGERFVQADGETLSQGCP